MLFNSHCLFSSLMFTTLLYRCIAITLLYGFHLSRLRTQLFHSKDKLSQHLHHPFTILPCGEEQTHTSRTQGPELSIGSHMRLHQFLGRDLPPLGRSTSQDTSKVVIPFSEPILWLSYPHISSPLSSAADEFLVYSGNSYYSLNSQLCILHYWISSHFCFSSLQGHLVLSIWQASQVCDISRLQQHAMFCAKVIHENIK